jgi:hypothetical protein
MVSTTLQNKTAAPEQSVAAPAVSILMPFNPKMSSKNDLTVYVRSVFEKVLQNLEAQYPRENLPVLEARLEGLMKKLDFSSYKQSIAIFVSPGMEKVYYLSFPVEEKLIINDNFEIRDLLYSKKDLHKYLILVLGSERSRIYIGNTSQFLCIESITPYHVATGKEMTGAADSVAKYVDEDKRSVYEKFLKHSDNSLGIILNAYKLPLFVMANEAVQKDFENITRHSDRIIARITGNFNDITEAGIRAAIAPYVHDWKKVKQEDLLNKLNAASKANNLVTGIEEVASRVAKRQGVLLALEKNYICPVGYKEGLEAGCFHEHGNENLAGIRDAVDDVIEQVLKNGADLEFVDEGVLTPYHHIALILTGGDSVDDTKTE